MSASAIISVAEYLKHVYEPDAEYVDGEVLERNLGEYDHARLQTLISRALGQFEDTHQIQVLVEQRVRVADTATKKRYRVPDILVFCQPFRITPVLLDPPLAVIEILSPEDRMSMMLTKVADYAQFGIKYIFVIDPAEHQLFLAEAGGLRPVPDDSVRFATPGGEIAVDLNPLFASLHPQP